MKSTKLNPLILAAATVIACFSGLAQAAVIVNDTFEDGLTNNGSNSLDAGWFLRFTSQASITTGADATGINSGNALIYTVSGVASSLVYGTMTTVNLGSNVNDAISLRFDFRIRTAGVSSAAGFRLGLFNSNGTPYAGDNTTLSDNDFGYHAAFGTGTAGSEIYETPANTNTRPFNTTNTAGFTTVGTDTEVNINDTIKHTAEFQIIRTSATDVALRLFYDGSLVAQRNDSSIMATSFDQIGMQASNSTLWNMDNVIVETLVIPEPSAALLGGLGLLVLLRRRRL